MAIIIPQCKDNICDCASHLCAGYGGLTDRAMRFCKNPNKVKYFEDGLYQQSIGTIIEKFGIAYIGSDFRHIITQLFLPSARAERVRDSSENFCKNPPGDGVPFFKIPNRETPREKVYDVQKQDTRLPTELIPPFAVTVSVAHEAARAISKIMPALQRASARLGYAGAAVSALLVIGGALFLSEGEAKASPTTLQPDSVSMAELTERLRAQYDSGISPENYDEQNLSEQLFSLVICFPFGGC